MEHPHGGIVNSIVKSGNIMKANPKITEQITPRVGFDTHRFVKRLTEVGMPEPQAEALATEQSQLLEYKSANERDIAEINRNTAEIKKETKNLDVRMKELDVRMKELEIGLEKSRMKTNRI